MERRVASDATIAGRVPPREEEQTDVEYVENNDTGSNYGDEDYEPHMTDVTTQSFPDPEFTDQNHPLGVCGPEEYAEFAVNPYLSTDFVTNNEDDDDNNNNIDENLQLDSESDRFSHLVDSQSKWRAHTYKTHQRFVTPPTEDTGEMTVRLSNHSDYTYSAIKAEEMASLQFLRDLCS